jgi:hypothetical protein
MKYSSVVRIMKSVSDKCRENQNTRFTLNNLFFFLENSAVYGIMWKNIVEPIRPQLTIRRMPIGCRIPKATDTQSEHVILIAFPLHLLQLSDRRGNHRCNLANNTGGGGQIRPYFYFTSRQTQGFSFVSICTSP